MFGLKIPRSSTQVVFDAYSSHAHKSIIRVAMGLPPLPPIIYGCTCGHDKSAHKRMKPNRAIMFGCKYCLCLMQPKDLL